MSHVLKPIEPPFDEAIENTLRHYPQQDGYLLKLFRVFANDERFLTKGVPNLLDKQSPLSLRQRELVILRVCARNQCEYEWGVHVAIFSAAAGLGSDQVNATTQRPFPQSLFDDEEVLLLEVVDHLVDVGRLPEPLLAKLRRSWNQAQQLEIFTLIGTYQTISYVANQADMELEGFAPRFPT